MIRLDRVFILLKVLTSEVIPEFIDEFKSSHFPIFLFLIDYLDIIYKSDNFSLEVNFENCKLRNR